MEQAGMFLQQHPGSGKVTTTSTKRSKLLQELKTLMQQVRANFSGQEITSETALFWLDEWSLLAETHGIDLLRDALRHHCRTQRFLPLPVDVSDAIAAVKKRKVEERLGAFPYVACSRCIDGLLVEEIEKDGVMRRQARECDCKKQWRASRNAAIPPRNRFARDDD
jgi:hypothetical protein